MPTTPWALRVRVIVKFKWREGNIRTFNRSFFRTNFSVPMSFAMLAAAPLKVVDAYVSTTRASAIWG